MLPICLDTFQTPLDIVAGDDASAYIAIVVSGRVGWILDVKLERRSEDSASYSCRARAGLNAGVVGIAKHAIAG